MTSSPLLPFGALPSRNQLAWQQLGMYAFFHFTVNTWTGREWGDGTEDESVFQPVGLDCDQWCRTVAAAGFKGAVLTTKHHDGFCLWPSAYTTHSVQSSSWRGGKGDVVAEFVAACRKNGLKIGFYLSPWDRHERSYGSGDDYNTYYCNQLKELLTVYGGPDVFMIWLDGACGEGPNGKVQHYDCARINAVVREFAPNAVVFGALDRYRDIRWCGNERGYAGAPNWATIGEADDHSVENLQHGVPNGKNWWPSEVDVSIRPGWFYHEAEDSQVHSLEHLLDIFYESVGRNSCLNLNIPPTPKGVLAAADVQRLNEFALVLRHTFTTDFSAGRAPVRTAPDEWTVEFGKPCTVNVVKLAENTALGQRVVRFAVDFRDAGGAWKQLAEGTTIGFSRLLRTPEVTTDALRLRIPEALAEPVPEVFRAFRQPPVRFAPRVRRDETGRVTMTAAAGVEIRYTLDGSAPDATSKRYTAPFEFPESGTLRAAAFLPAGAVSEFPEIDAIPERRVDFGVLRSGWRVAGCDSEIRRRGHESENVLDENPHFWLTADDGRYPHWITLDTAVSREWRGVVMTPPEIAELRLGVVRHCRGYVSDSPTERGEPVFERVFDNLANNPLPQRVEFDRPVRGRYFTFEGLDASDGKNYLCVKSFELF